MQCVSHSLAIEIPGWDEVFVGFGLLFMNILEFRVSRVEELVSYGDGIVDGVTIMGDEMNMS